MMSFCNLFLLHWVLCLLIYMSSAMDDWTTTCPAFCQCRLFIQTAKWADCPHGNVSKIPKGLSSEIQLINLSDNPLDTLSEKSFVSVGLINLQRIFLKNCQIDVLHKEAFNELQSLIQLDLSGNLIHTIPSGIFRENPMLQFLYLNKNPIKMLEEGLFSNLRYLQVIDLSDCQINRIGQNTFESVPSLQYLMLHNNQLSYIPLSSVESLQHLKTLELHNNPWRCDCQLKQFRDWTLSRKLYVRPTSCAAPERLKDEFWDETASREFVCPPEVLVPETGSIVEGAGDVTMSCKVKGDPIPEVFWIYRSRVVNNHTRVWFNKHRFSISESTDAETRWVNLTLLHVQPQDRGVFTCVARNPGGVAERIITLTASDVFVGPINVSDDLSFLLAVVFLLVTNGVLLVMVIRCYKSVFHKIPPAISVYYDKQAKDRQVRFRPEPEIIYVGQNQWKEGGSGEDSGLWVNDVRSTVRRNTNCKHSQTDERKTDFYDDFLMFFHNNLHRVVTTPVKLVPDSF